MYRKVLSRFKFILKDNYKFNYYIIIDIIYLNGKLVIYIVDEAPIF